jgi:DNA-binding NarL/FixJ family response regulator
MDAPPVQYVTTRDGLSIAYAVSGNGRPVIWMPHLFSHIQVYWREQTYIRDWLTGLASQFRLIQYDGRGQGMSTRGLRPDMHLTDLMLDLEAVVDRLELDRFVLVAVGWSGHVAVHYSVQNPDRVQAMVLTTAFPLHHAERPVMAQLAERDWSAYMRMIAALGQPPDVSDSLARLQQTVTQADHLALARAWNSSDVTDLLPQLRVPALVLHPRDNFSLSMERATALASSIPASHMVITDGRTTPGDATQGIRAIQDFLRELPDRSASTSQGAPASLSLREVEVLRLLAGGKSNQQIADELVISLNTVRRHVSNIFDKTGAANRAQAAIYAKDHGIA